MGLCSGRLRCNNRATKSATPVYARSNSICFYYYCMILSFFIDSFTIFNRSIGHFYWSLLESIVPFQSHHPDAWIIFTTRIIITRCRGRRKNYRVWIYKLTLIAIFTKLTLVFLTQILFFFCVTLYLDYHLVPIQLFRDWSLNVKLLFQTNPR